MTLAGIGRLHWIVALGLVVGCSQSPPAQNSADPAVPGGSAGTSSPSRLATSSRLSSASRRPATEAKASPPESQRDAGKPVSPESVPAFTDVHDAAGVVHAYDTGSTGQALMVESTGGGAAWLDYDRDGRLDLYLIQGGSPVAKNPRDNESDALYRNVGGGRFELVGAAGWLVEGGYSQCAAVADFDNDGFPDIYVSNVGPNAFFRNLGDGTFMECADASGMQDPRWSSSAAWADLDLDGDLDLYVCNYLVYDPHHPLPCKKANGQPTTCHPEELNPVPNDCFENLGDGTFREVSTAWGLVGDGSKSLGVVIADLAGDHRPDIYVANDTTANFLYVNEGGGRFVEKGVALGCALSGDGLYQASMGIAYGDYDNNGYPDLYVTHFTDDYNTLYANLGPPGFQDVTQVEGLVTPVLKYLAFGTVMADFDRDGHQDLFIANGHIDDWRDKGKLYHMPPQLFSYDGKGRWHEGSARAGDYFRHEYLGRAVASSDFDEDGDLDLAVAHQNAPAAILRNDAQQGHWMKFRFLGTQSNRDGWLTRVTVTQGSQRWTQQLASGGSYAATHEPILLFALPSPDPATVEVVWTSGVRQVLEGVSVNREWRLQEP